ncbi:PQQ-binding-like beta-propeller repeat protein [Candidatus Latescibacterota bacterium]
MRAPIGLFVSTAIAHMAIICGCAAGNQFVDGLAVVAGQGGRIARQDAFGPTVELANKLNEDQPPTRWETLVASEGADFIAFLDDERVLVGTVESGSYLGVPRHGDIKLFGAETGNVIWSAGREGLRNGQYVLLAITPLIVVVGRDDNGTTFIAYEPDTGSRRWTHEVDAPDQFVVSEAMDRIISLSPDGSGRRIEALDIETGSTVWSQQLPADSFSAEIPDALISADNDLFVIGRRIHKLTGRDGTLIWSTSHPVLEAHDRSIHHVPQGLLAYGSRETVLLNEEDGSTRWAHSVRESAIQVATVLDGRAYIVTAGHNSAPEFSAETIQALDSENGEALWSKRIEGRIVSPISMQDGVLAFSTDGALHGVMAKTGEQLFQSPFSEEFISGSPSSAATLHPPDVIGFGDGTLYLVREMAGVRAHAFPSGAELWEQMNFNYPSRIYSADRLYTVLARDLGPGNPQSSTATPVPETGSSSNSPSPFIKSAQRLYESRRQRANAVLSNRRATTGDRESARQSQAMNARLMAANQRVDMAMGQMQAAADLLNAVVGLQGSIQTALETAAVQGVISRKHMELRSLSSLQQACLQGRYYLWPFFDQGRGVTLVDLETGKRHDLVFSPQMQPLDTYGVDLPTFCIGPDGKTLIMVGVGMDSGKYEEHVKWQSRMPRPSVLAYDLSTFSFMDTSLTQKKAEQAAMRLQEVIAEAVALAQANTAQWQANMAKRQLHDAAQSRDLALVQSLLDAGISANAQHPDDGSGPLIWAILGGSADVARLLIEHGADVNERTKEGKSALFWAKNFGNPEIVTLLEQAGAK